MERTTVEQEIVDGVNGKGKVVEVVLMESVPSNPGHSGRSFNSVIVPIAVPVIDENSSDEEEEKAMEDAKKIALGQVATVLNNELEGL